MKIQLVSTALAMLACSSLAAECTQTQLSKFDSLGTNAEFEKACAKVIAASSATTIDASTLANLNPCNDQSCLAFYKKLASDVPDCELAGFSLKDTFNLVFSLCTGSPSDMPSVPGKATATPIDNSLGKNGTMDGGAPTAPTVATTAPSEASSVPSPSPSSSASMTAVATAVTVLLPLATLAGTA